MFRRTLIASVLGCFLVMSAGAADVVVRVGPPHARVERRPRAPGREFVWTPGYYRWDGHDYGWVAGTWVRPPHRHARWVAPRWTHRRDGWFFIEGHWR